MKNKFWHASFTYHLRNRFMSSQAALEGAIICDDKGWSKQAKADSHALVFSSCAWAITLQSLHSAWGILLTMNRHQAETASRAYREFPLLAHPSRTKSPGMAVPSPEYWPLAAATQASADWNWTRKQQESLKNCCVTTVSGGDVWSTSFKSFWGNTVVFSYCNITQSTARPPACIRSSDADCEWTRNHL